jgi:hypothetical protein
MPELQHIMLRQGEIPLPADDEVVVDGDVQTFGGLIMVIYLLMEDVIGD